MTKHIKLFENFTNNNIHFIGLRRDIIEKFGNIEYKFFIGENYIGKLNIECLTKDGYLIGKDFPVTAYEMHISHFEIEAQHRGNGYSKTILTEIFSQTNTNISLIVEKDNIVAYNLYKKMGFETVDNFKYYDGIGKTILEKQNRPNSLYLIKSN